MLLVGPLHFGLIYVGFHLVQNVSLLGVTLQLWVPLNVGPDGWEAIGTVVDDIRSEVSDGPDGLDAYVTGPAGSAADSSEAFEGIDGALLFAALGETVTERAGVLNLGVEGMMLAGAVAAFAAAFGTGSHALGLHLRDDRVPGDEGYSYELAWGEHLTIERGDSPDAAAPDLSTDPSPDPSPEPAHGTGSGPFARLAELHVAGDWANPFQVQHPDDHLYASSTGSVWDCPQPDLGLVPGDPVRTSLGRNER